MSLKTFHLIFIICSGILSLGLAFWGVRGYVHDQGNAFLGWGSLGLVLAVALFFYERWFSGKNGPLARHD